MKFTRLTSLVLVLMVILPCIIGWPTDKFSPKNDKPFLGEKYPGGRNLENDRKTAESLFDAELKTYKEDLSQLVENMQLQAAVIVVAIMLLCRQSKEMEVPILGMKLSIDWLHFLVPLVGAYLWVMFGYQLNNLIEQRLALWSLLDFAGDDKSYPLLSRRDLLADSGFLEAWFISFWKYQTLTLPTALTKVMFGIFFGAFFGMAHASVVITFWAGCQRFLNNGYRILGRIIPPFFFLLIVATHIQFAYQGHNPNWFQITIVLWWILSMYALMALYLIAEKNKQAKKHHHALRQS